MYVFEKIIDLYCSQNFQLILSGKKWSAPLCSAGLQFIRRRMMQN